MCTCDKIKSHFKDIFSLIQPLHMRQKYWKQPKQNFIASIKTITKLIPRLHDKINI